MLITSDRTRQLRNKELLSDAVVEIDKTRKQS